MERVDEDDDRGLYHIVYPGGFDNHQLGKVLQRLREEAKTSGLSWEQAVALAKGIGFEERIAELMLKRLQFECDIVMGSDNLWRTRTYGEKHTQIGDHSSDQEAM